MKKLLLTLALALSASISFAETDAKALNAINDIRRGKDNANAILDLLVKDDTILQGDLNVGGNVTHSGTVTAVVGSPITVVNTNTVPQVDAQTAVTATNAYIIPATAPTYILQGGAASNVLVLPTPARAGQTLKLICNSTNIMQLDEGATFQGAGGFTGGIYDTITLESMTTQWIERARSNN